jgi:hypothetical protein
MKPIKPPCQAIKECIHDDELDLDWLNRPLNPCNPKPDGFDQLALRSFGEEVSPK